MERYACAGSALARAEIERLNKLGLIKPVDYEMIMRTTAIEGANASMMVQADFEKYIKKFFNIVAVHYGREHTAPWHPIYVLKIK